MNLPSRRRATTRTGVTDGGRSPGCGMPPTVQKPEAEASLGMQGRAGDGFHPCSAAARRMPERIAIAMATTIRRVDRQHNANAAWVESRGEKPLPAPRQVLRMQRKRCAEARSRRPANPRRGKAACIRVLLFQATDRPISLQAIHIIATPESPVFMSSNSLWLAVGFAGQALFGMRFFVQWLHSEARRKSVIPLTFWHLSIAGGIVLLGYAIHRREPVFIVGEAVSLMIFARNLQLTLRKPD